MEMLYPLPSPLRGSCLATAETRRAHARRADMNKRLISRSRVLNFSFSFLFSFLLFVCLLRLYGVTLQADQVHLYNIHYHRHIDTFEYRPNTLD